jgi:hypothetical protein
VITINESTFKFFMRIINSLEESDIKGVSIAGSLHKIIEHYDGHMTPEQKKIIWDQYRKYRESKERKTERMRLIEEEMDYRRSIRDIMNVEDDSGSGSNF